MAQTILGFDLGRRRIGVAVGETLTGAARALTTITVARGGEIPWEEILATVADWRPARLVIGLPRHLDGREAPFAAAARAFAAELGRRTRLPTSLWDEALTSEAARAALAERRRAGARRGGRGRLDAEAAREILAGWLSAGRDE